MLLIYFCIFYSATRLLLEFIASTLKPFLLFNKQDFGSWENSWKIE
jgi:hypothetical protein